MTCERSKVHIEQAWGTRRSVRVSWVWIQGPLHMTTVLKSKLLRNDRVTVGTGEALSVPWLMTICATQP